MSGAFAIIRLGKGGWIVCGTHTRRTYMCSIHTAPIFGACIFVCKPCSRTPLTVGPDHLMSNLICDGTIYGIIEVNNKPCGLYNQNRTEQKKNRNKTAMKQ